MSHWVSSWVSFYAAFSSSFLPHFIIEQTIAIEGVLRLLSEWILAAGLIAIFVKKAAMACCQII